MEPVDQTTLALVERLTRLEAVIGPLSQTTAGFGDRLAKLEGLMIGLQASFTQSQSNLGGYLSRVEQLERRQVELEAKVVTRSDLKTLTDQVQTLAQVVSKGQGGAGLLGYLITAGIAAAAATAAILTVLSATQVNMPPMQQQPYPIQQQTQP